MTFLANSTSFTQFLPVKGIKQGYFLKRIFCVGRNYAAHAREMGADPDKEPPFFFNKSPSNALFYDGVNTVLMPYPKGTNLLHHEIELAVALGDGGDIFGYAPALDMTRRDLQNSAKSKGHPWSFGKDFEGGAIIGALIPAGNIDDIEKSKISLKVNNTLRQEALISDMIWNVKGIIENLSNYYNLGMGDIILTGTPEGVGSVNIGDELSGDIEFIGSLNVKIV